MKIEIISVLLTLRRVRENCLRCILNINELLQFVQQSNNQIFVSPIGSQQGFEDNIENVCRYLFLLLTLHSEKRFKW